MYIKQGSKQEPQADCELQLSTSFSSLFRMRKYEEEADGGWKRSFVVDIMPYLAAALLLKRKCSYCVIRSVVGIQYSAVVVFFENNTVEYISFFTMASYGFLYVDGFVEFRVNTFSSSCHFIRAGLVLL